LTRQQILFFIFAAELNFLQEVDFNYFQNNKYLDKSIAGAVRLNTSGVQMSPKGINR